MTEGRQKKGKTRDAKWLAFALLCLCFSSQTAYAQVVLNPPTSASITSPFGPRTHPVTGVAGTPHMGIDYGVPCGTPVPTAASTMECKMNRGGWGLYGESSYACGVKTIDGHLSSCTTGGAMVSGGAAGSENSGSSTGCHLHHEIWIDNARINPASAYGKNLCDGEVRKALIDEAQQMTNGKSGGGAGASATSNAPAPAPNTNTPQESYTEVRTGEKDPGTGVVNTGPTYYVVTTPDGRTRREYIPGDEPMDGNMLPPTTSDIVPAGAATNNEVTGCGTDTWRAMVNQAVLQTRREMLMNERYIAKADSVMAYSCFSQMLENAGKYLGVFSETRQWVNKSVPIIDGNVVVVNVFMGAYSLDGAINNAALEPYEAWLRSNFNHPFLGGLLGGSGGGSGGHDAESTSSQQSSAPCGMMAQVWQQAKCMNMTDQPMFYHFEDLIGNDPRKYPEVYACHDSGIFQNMIDIAKNKEAEFSKVITHLDRIKPPGGACVDPIPTGVTVTTREGADRLTKELTYQDALCVSAGCSYQRDSGTAGRCEVKMPRRGSQ